MLQDSLDCVQHVAAALLLIINPARLQVAVRGRDMIVLGQVLTQVNDLEFVATGENDWQVATVAEASLGRQGHPVDAVGQGTGAVGFNSDALARHLFQASDEILVNPQRRLAAREHDERGIGVLHHLLDDLGQ